MTPHLSLEQISEKLSGSNAATIDAHLRECPVCRAEFGRLEQVLAQFRGSVRAWSDGQYRAPVADPQPAGHGWMGLRRPAWAALAMALVLLLCLALGWPSRHRRAESAASDVALLKQVDAALSRTVPRPLEPLSRLITWELAADSKSAPGEKIEKQ